MNSRRGRESGRNAEEKKAKGYREAILVCTTLILGAKIDVKASNVCTFAPWFFFFPLLPLLFYVIIMDAGGLYDSFLAFISFI